MPNAEASRRNGRKGGRPKGSKDPHTLAREFARTELQNRIIAERARVFDAYLERAKGVFVMIEFTELGPQRITSEKRIHQLLADKAKVPGKDYAFVETHAPDGKVLLDVIARLDGKPAERVEISGPDAGPLTIHHHFASA